MLQFLFLICPIFSIFIRQKIFECPEKFIKIGQKEEETICTQEYAPVCGYLQNCQSNDEENCKQTFTNSCEACKQNISYYTQLPCQYKKDFQNRQRFYCNQNSCDQNILGSVVCGKKSKIIGDQSMYKQFDNECDACKDKNIIYYEKGECYRNIL